MANSDKSTCLIWELKVQLYHLLARATHVVWYLQQTHYNQLLLMSFLVNPLSSNNLHDAGFIHYLYMKVVCLFPRDLTLTTDHSIARYIARCYPSFGLYGKNTLQASEVSRA